jgi:small subunit ribosomal protein S3
MHQGRVPLHTIRADIDYGITEAHTTMGRLGIKVWIYKGDVLPEKKEIEATEVSTQAPAGSINATAPASVPVVSEEKDASTKAS